MGAQSKIGSDADLRDACWSPSLSSTALHLSTKILKMNTTDDVSLKQAIMDRYARRVRVALGFVKLSREECRQEYVERLLGEVVCRVLESAPGLYDDNFE